MGGNFTSYALRGEGLECILLASVSAFFFVYWMVRTLSASGSGVGGPHRDAVWAVMVVIQK